MISKDDLKEQLTNELALRRINHHLITVLGLPKSKYLLISFAVSTSSGKVFIKLDLEPENEDGRVCIDLEGYDNPSAVKYVWGMNIVPCEVTFIGMFKIWRLKGYLSAVTKHDD